jgi:hypothetical protein
MKDNRRKGHKVDTATKQGSVTEGKEIIPAFSALIREYKAAQYLLLGLWRNGQFTRNNLRLDDFLAVLGVGRGPQRDYTALVPTYLRTARKLPPATNDEERLQRWMAEYVAEVEVCVERFKGDAELTDELARLTTAIEGYNVWEDDEDTWAFYDNGWLQGTNELKDTKARLLRQLADLSGTGPAKPFERTAAAQYDKMLKEELPGFSICPFPMHLSIGTRRTYPTIYPGIEGNEAWVRDPSRWNGIGRALRSSGKHIPDGPLKERLSRWSYSEIVPDGLPDPNDIPNPRQYQLDGATVPDERMERKGKRLSSAANTIFVQFTSMVRRAYESPMNLRDQALKDLLDRHFEKGGSPDAFVKFIEDWGPGYRVSGEKRTPTFTGPIQKALAAWVTARQRPNAQATATMVRPEELGPLPCSTICRNERQRR